MKDLHYSWVYIKYVSKGNFTEGLQFSIHQGIALSTIRTSMQQ